MINLLLNAAQAMPDGGALEVATRQVKRTRPGLEASTLELRTLATEARQKLDRVRPSSLAQAARIPGVTPSDLHNLVLEATRWRRRVA